MKPPACSDGAAACSIEKLVARAQLLERRIEALVVQLRHAREDLRYLTALLYEFESPDEPDAPADSDV